MKAGGYRAGRNTAAVPERADGCTADARKILLDPGIRRIVLRQAALVYPEEVRDALLDAVAFFATFGNGQKN